MIGFGEAAPRDENAPGPPDSTLILGRGRTGTLRHEPIPERAPHIRYLELDDSIP